MNAATPQSNFGYNTQALRSDRDTEYDIFSRVTKMLRQSAPDGRSLEAIHAIHKNNELWTILATDLAAPGNTLPDEVKAGLLSLAAFALRHGHAVLNGQGTTDALIDINLSVMKGLRSEVSA